MVCRRVNRSWKVNVENGSAIYKALTDNALVQFWVHKEPETEEFRLRPDPAPNPVDERHIYRCTQFDAMEKTVTFTPLPRRLPCTIDNDTIWEWTSQYHRYYSIHIEQITNSLFPGCKPFIPSGIQPPLRNQTHRTIPKVRAYDVPTGYVYNGSFERDKCMKRSQEDVDKFDAMPEVRTEAQVLEMQWKDECRFPVGSRFDRPKVEVDVRYGPYIFKCHYLTRWKYLQDIHDSLGWDRWDARYILVINAIQVSVADVCRWRCSCKKGDMQTPCDLDTLVSWKCPSLYRLTDDHYRHPLIDVTSRSLSDADKQWMKETQTHGKLRFVDFIPGQIENQKRINREHGRNTPPCSKCRLWLPDKRCVNGLCRRCCLSPECNMHGECSECRMMKFQRYREKWQRIKSEPRPCLRSFNGVECKERRKATHLAWQLHGKGHPAELIYRFGCSKAEMGKRMGGIQ
jgi:hypothetical protein